MGVSNRYNSIYWYIITKTAYCTSKYISSGVGIEAAKEEKRSGEA